MQSNSFLMPSSSIDGTSAESCWNLINPILSTLLDSMIVNFSNSYKAEVMAYLAANLILMLTWWSRVGQLLWQPSVQTMSILQTRFPGLVKPICFFTTQMIGFENQGQVKCSDPVLGKGQ